MAQASLLNDGYRRDEAIDYFADWNDLQFSIWLGGFFDGEGTVYLPKNPLGGVSVSIGNTNRDVIESIHRRLGVGHFSIEQPDNPKWNTKFTWRVRRMDDVAKVLALLMPWVTLKSEAVSRGHQRLIEYRGRRSDVTERHRQILELSAEGLSHDAISAKVGRTRALVSAVINAAGTRTNPGAPVFKDQRKHRRR